MSVFMLGFVGGLVVNFDITTYLSVRDEFQVVG
jgi:hypothetical protein